MSVVPTASLAPSAPAECNIYGHLESSMFIRPAPLNVSRLIREIFPTNADASRDLSDRGLVAGLSIFSADYYSATAGIARSSIGSTYSRSNVLASLISGVAMFRNQSVGSTTDANWSVPMRWDYLSLGPADPPWLHYTYFPAIFYNPSLARMDCCVFACFYASFLPNDRLVGHRPNWAKPKFADLNTVCVDTTLIGDDNSLWSITSALNLTFPQRGSYVWFSPMSDNRFCENPMPIKGASLGLSLAACIMGAPSIAYTGFVRHLPGVKTFKNGMPIPAIRTDDIIADVDGISHKAAWAILNHFPLVIPHLNELKQNLQEVLSKELYRSNRFALEMGTYFYSTVQMDQGIPYASVMSPILLATSVPEAVQLATVAYMTYFVPPTVPGNTRGAAASLDIRERGVQQYRRFKQMENDFGPKRYTAEALAAAAPFRMRPHKKDRRGYSKTRQNLSTYAHGLGPIAYRRYDDTFTRENRMTVHPSRRSKWYLGNDGRYHPQPKQKKKKSRSSSLPWGQAMMDRKKKKKKGSKRSKSSKSSKKSSKSSKSKSSKKSRSKSSKKSKSSRSSLSSRKSPRKGMKTPKRHKAKRDPETGQYMSAAGDFCSNASGDFGTSIGSDDDVRSSIVSAAPSVLSAASASKIFDAPLDARHRKMWETRMWKSLTKRKIPKKHHKRYIRHPHKIPQKLSTLRHDAARHWLRYFEHQQIMNNKDKMTKAEFKKVVKAYRSKWKKSKKSSKGGSRATSLSSARSGRSGPNWWKHYGRSKSRSSRGGSASPPPKRSSPQKRAPVYSPTTRNKILASRGIKVTPTQKRAATPARARTPSKARTPSRSRTPTRSMTPSRSAKKHGKKIVQKRSKSAGTSVSGATPHKKKKAKTTPSKKKKSKSKSHSKSSKSSKKSSKKSSSKKSSKKSSRSKSSKSSTKSPRKKRGRSSKKKHGKKSRSVSFGGEYIARPDAPSTFVDQTDDMWNYLATAHPDLSVWRADHPAKTPKKTRGPRKKPAANYTVWTDPYDPYASVVGLGDLGPTDKVYLPTLRPDGRGTYTTLRVPWAKAQEMIAANPALYGAPSPATGGSPGSATGGSVGRSSSVSPSMAPIAPSYSPQPYRTASPSMSPGAPVIVPTYPSSGAVPAKRAGSKGKAGVTYPWALTKETPEAVFKRLGSVDPNMLSTVDQAHLLAADIKLDANVATTSFAQWLGGIRWVPDLGPLLSHDTGLGLRSAAMDMLFQVMQNGSAPATLKSLCVAALGAAYALPMTMLRICAYAMSHFNLDDPAVWAGQFTQYQLQISDALQGCMRFIQQLNIDGGDTLVLGQILDLTRTFVDFSTDKQWIGTFRPWYFIISGVQSPEMPSIHLFSHVVREYAANMMQKLTPVVQTILSDVLADIDKFPSKVTPISVGPDSFEFALISNPHIQPLQKKLADLKKKLANTRGFSTPRSGNTPRGAPAGAMPLLLGPPPGPPPPVPSGGAAAPVPPPLPPSRYGTPSGSPVATPRAPTRYGTPAGTPRGPGPASPTPRNTPSPVVPPLLIPPASYSPSPRAGSIAMIPGYETGVRTTSPGQSVPRPRLTAEQRRAQDEYEQTVARLARESVARDAAMAAQEEELARAAVRGNAGGSAAVARDFRDAGELRQQRRGRGPGPGYTSEARMRQIMDAPYTPAAKAKQAARAKSPLKGDTAPRQRVLSTAPVKHTPPQGRTRFARQKQAEEEARRAASEAAIEASNLGGLFSRGQFYPYR